MKIEFQFGLVIVFFGYNNVLVINSKFKNWKNNLIIMEDNFSEDIIQEVTNLLENS